MRRKIERRTDDADRVAKDIRHAYIKPSSPQLNGKVERSQRSDEQEFYQLLTYKGDVDLEAKLAQWERFYNLARPLQLHDQFHLRLDTS